ncbi:MAG: phosphoribosylformylglycinamidine cyclo-ligase [Clostridiales bacterium]|nr:phosphoribosylformylglycinamidine cyclo-ligase [Clostridiales bacterium]MCF8021685.1 phosphoribosylformylglycinamidine cyclo-ligase [Clostridiales bacterium]
MNEKKEPLTYAASGVDIDAGNKAVDLMRTAVKSTHRPEVIDDIGGFSGLFAPDMSHCREPVLVSGTDGVGTKLKIAMLMDKHDTIGIDCAAMCINDILVQGAEPLFFLDYLAVGKMKPENVASIVSGVARGCSQAGCALIGGETAEMPGFYGEDEYDLAGFVVGMVDKNSIITGSSINSGDVLIGLPSTGLHSNGYSLARKALLDRAGYKMDTYLSTLGRTVGEEMLEPTRVYVKLVQPLLKRFNIKGMAHVTGGGLVDNVPRMLPTGTGARIHKDSWQIPPVFKLIKGITELRDYEMLRTFNMGIGLIIAVPCSQYQAVLNALAENGEKAYCIGEVTRDEGITFC